VSNKKIKKTRNKFAVVVKQDKTFAVFFSILMGFWLVVFLWSFFATIKDLFFEGALLDHIRRFPNLEPIEKLAIFLSPVFIIVPLLMIFVIIYLVKKVICNYYLDKRFYIIFSNSGITMAGHFTSWNSIMWIGGKKNLFNSKIYICWAITHSHSGQICIEMPAIQPFSEVFFFMVCKKIIATFPNEIGHLKQKSWKVINFSDLGGMVIKQTLIPWSSSSEINCEILQDCALVHKI
jgi:hypothetical protein